MKLSIFVVCVVLEVSLGSEPQVYEDVEDQMQVESNPRVVRQPFSRSKGREYTPPSFQFQRTVQQDPRQFRYAQQQKADMQNILRKNRMIKQAAPLRLSLNWKAIDPTVSSSLIQQNYKLPEEQSNTTGKEKVPSTKKPVTSRKLKPSSYYEDIVDDRIKRQDRSQVIYVNPEAKNRRSEYDLNALSALVGQDPNNQLEGLKRLLQTPQTNFILPSLIKGPLPHPMSENSEDVPNPNSHPNIDTSLSVEDIQSQLDEAAKAQVAKAFAEAQKQALAQVEAQHQAIAKAQIEAQKKAMAQIAFHNQKIKEEPLPQPQALKQKPIPVQLYAPTHSHEQPNQAQSKPTLKKISITKTHSVKQGHQSPNAYQQVVLETQQKSQKVLPGVNQLSLEDAAAHQYAARYAFGYKIRDIKMGNEFGHEEKRDGENARGLYHVLLPDGRMQKVEYYADPSGYHAKVTYENLAHH